MNYFTAFIGFIGFCSIVIGQIMICKWIWRKLTNVIQNKVIEELTKEYAEYLEKEKEQIIDFGYKCRNKCKKDSTLLPQDIFNQTYNQNK